MLRRALAVLTPLLFCSGSPGGPPAAAADPPILAARPLPTPFALPRSGAAALDPTAIPPLQQVAHLFPPTRDPLDGGPVARDTAAHVLGWALHLSGDAVPGEPPRFVAVSEWRMRELGCEPGARACTPVALFRPAEPDRIYMLDFLDPGTRLGDRAVLVHEVVHWLQEKRAAPGTSCQREREAYLHQARYLQAHGVRVGAPAATHGVTPAATLDWECE